MSTGRSESRKRTRNKDQTIHRHLEASSTSGFSTVRTTFAASSRSSSTATTVWWIYVCALYSVAIPSTNRSPVLRVIDLPTAPVRHLHLQILGSRRSTWAPDDRLGFSKHHKKAEIAAGPVNRVERIDSFRYSQNLGVRVNVCELGTINLGSGRSMEDVLGSILSLPYV
jgi:hypothetical protein